MHNTLTAKDYIDLAEVAKNSGAIELEIAEKAFEKLSEGLDVSDAKSEIIGLLVYLINQYVIPKAKQVIIDRVNLEKPIVIDADTFELKIETKPKS
jgi:hypothetical protein